MSLPVFFASPCRSRAVTSASLYLIKVCAAVCAFTLLLSLAMPPAIAQSSSTQWVPTYQASGTNTSEDTFANPAPAPTLWSPNWTGGFTSGYQFGHVVSDGTVAATLAWPSAGSPPPDQQRSLPVLETASAFINRRSTAGGPLLADDGFGDPLGPSSPWNPMALRASGSHLTLVPVSQGTDGKWRAVVPARHLGMEAGLAGQGHGNGNEIGGAYSVQQDTRAVTITRFNARQTGKVLSPDGKQYGEWVDPDGTGHGDTIYSYTRTTNSTNPYSGPETNFEDIINWQYFEAMFSGDWPVVLSGTFPPDVTWSWNPGESDDDWGFAKWSMVHGNINVVDGDAVGTKTGTVKKTMTYTATDNRNPDHATATAHYELTIHDPIEWTMDKGSPKALAPNLTGAVDYAVSAGSDVIVTFDPPKGTLDYSDIFKGLSIVTGTLAALSIPATEGADTEPATAYIGMLLSGISATAGSYAPGTKQDQKTFSSSQANFEQDIFAQELINSGDSNRVDFPETARFDGSTNFGDVQINPESWYTGHGGTGFWTVTAQAVEYRSDVFWTGMVFDEAGYAGLTHSHANYRTRIDDTKCVRLWHFNLITPR